MISVLSRMHVGRQCGGEHDKLYVVSRTWLTYRCTASLPVTGPKARQLWAFRFPLRETVNFDAREQRHELRLDVSLLRKAVQCSAARLCLDNAVPRFVWVGLPPARKYLSAGCSKRVSGDRRGDAIGFSTLHKAAMQGTPTSRKSGSHTPASPDYFFLK